MRERLQELITEYGGYTRFAADLGVSERTVYMICKGYVNPSLKRAFKMAVLLESTVDKIFSDLKPKQ